MRNATMILCLLLAATGAPAADSSSATALDADSIDAVFADYDSTTSPGCALGVIQDGRLTYGRGYGMANLEHGVPLATDSVLRIGSTSKQFTAMAILLLERQGKLGLDDDVRKIIPELQPTTPAITLRQLLHHTSGIRDYLTLTWLAGYRDEDFYTDADVLDLLARQQATDFPPGSRHSYSNSGYFLLSQIVLRVAGKSLKEFADEAMFTPLGMTHTHFHDDHTHLVPRRAAGYAEREEGGLAISQTTLEMVGDGGIFTSIEDLLAWDANFYQPRIGDQALLAAMQTPGVLTDGEALTYALGLVVDEYRGLERVHHGGAFVGYRAQLMRFPSEKTSIAVLCNLAQTSPTRLALAVADIILADRLAPATDGEAAAPAEGVAPPTPAASLPAATRDRWLGAYRHADQGFILRVEAEEDSLALAFPWEERVSLAPIDASHFVERDDPAGMRFEFSPGGMEISFTDGRKPAIYERVKLTTPDRPLEPYLGTYYSSEVDATYRLVLEDGHLLLRNANSSRQAPFDSPLEPTSEDAFQLQHLPIEFVRRDGEVTGFKLSAGRVRDLYFVKQ